MTKVGELQGLVAAGYARLGMPSWPNPHAGLASPRDEEYSRTSEPERYRIVQARARVWAERLGELAGVQVETLPPADDRGHLGGFDRGVRVAPKRPGTLPLLLLEQDVPVTGLDAWLPVLQISAVRPELTLEVLPDCGCDACDSGSEDLLRAVDQTIRRFVDGPFVMLRGSAWHAQWHRDGGASSGTGGRRAHAELMEVCRRLAGGQDVRLPMGAEAFVGRPWLG